jgi:hypothetical protein
MVIVARGQITGARYTETDIVNPSTYARMQMEPLFLEDDPDVLVWPIRREGAPHFRRSSNAGSIYRSLVGRRETDPTHSRCVETLTRELCAKRLRVWSATFDGESRDPQGFAVHGQGDDVYDWWQDGAACRIPLSDGRFIQPDICGRSRASLFPTARSRSIVIEVVQTHLPEEETFFALLELSRWNYVVLFYYVAPGKLHSKYSWFRSGEHEVDITVAYFLLNGVVYRNGREFENRTNSDSEWYQYLRATYFATPMEKK